MWVKLIKKIIFNNRVYGGAISPCGRYFAPKTKDSIYVFNSFGNYLWGVERKNFIIYDYFNGQRYFERYPFPEGKAIVKNLQSHNSLYSITKVQHLGENYPIYKCGIVDNTAVIWVSNYIGEKEVFNFIDSHGSLLKEIALPSNIQNHLIKSSIRGDTINYSIKENH